MPADTMPVSQKLLRVCRIMGLNIVKTSGMTKSGSKNSVKLGTSCSANIRIILVTNVPPLLPVDTIVSDAASRYTP